MWMFLTKRISEWKSLVFFLFFLIAKIEAQPAREGYISRKRQHSADSVITRCINLTYTSPFPHRSCSFLTLHTTSYEEYLVCKLFPTPRTNSTSPPGDGETNMHIRIRTQLSASDQVMYMCLYAVAKNGIDETLYPYKDLSSHFLDNELYRDLKDHVMSKKRAYFPKRHPGMPLLPESLNLEFTDLGYRCCFEVWDGIGQWFYDPIPSSPGCKLSSGVEKCLHSFFSREMVTGGLEAFYMVEKLLYDQEQLKVSNLVYQTGLRRCYNLKMYVEYEAESPCDWDTNYTEYSVSANSMLADVFTALCGRNTTDNQQNLRRDFTLTQIIRKGTEKGRAYTWGGAIETGILMRDLEWVCEDGIIWVLPSPCNFLSG